MTATTTPMAPVAVQPEPKAATGEVKLPWYKKGPSFGRTVKTEEVMNFSRQSAAFMRAGVPILDALGIVAEETSSAQMTAVLRDVQQRLRNGSSFGDAVAAHPTVFPGYYIAIVRAAELTGQLDDAFEQLSRYLERDIAARRQVKSALTYPAFVFALAILAVVVMSMWVLPKFKGFYSSLGAHLPLPTRMLLGFTDFVGQWWLVILAVIAGLLLLAFAIIGGKHGKARRDAALLRLPAIGKLVHLIAVERFCRVLATLVSTGVPLPDAVTVSADSTNNRVFQTKLAVAREAMMRGEGLARPIAAAGIFPAAARQMIRVGESTGSLDQQLQSAAAFYERELEYRLKKATDLFEPIVIVVVGGVVAFVAVAQIAAMYSVYHQIKA
jgi:type IV pilus assembly protein PilC